MRMEQGCVCNYVCVRVREGARDNYTRTGNQNRRGVRTKLLSKREKEEQKNSWGMNKLHVCAKQCTYCMGCMCISK